MSRAKGRPPARLPVDFVDEAMESCASIKAIAERQEFWVDSCRGVSKSQAASMQVQELYQKFGCRFIPPTHNDVQYILDALDSAMPLWDRDHPELFFQTLQLNFPQLLRHSA